MFDVESQSLRKSGQFLLLFIIMQLCEYVLYGRNPFVNQVNSYNEIYMEA